MSEPIAPSEFVRLPHPPEEERYTRSWLALRLGAVAIAVLISGAVIWSYAMTATIIRHFLDQPVAQTGPPVQPGLVTVTVLPPSATTAKPHE